MTDRQRPVALVTGASAGIGEAIARELAGAEHDLVLVARRTARLRTVARALREDFGVAATVRAADLLEPDAALTLAEGLEADGVEVDVLVNNAGVLESGLFLDTEPLLMQRMIQLNNGALTDMLAHFLPAMQERGRGRVLNVASIAAFQPVVGLAAYAATKAYVLSLSEALMEELRGSGVTVTALCPGITATDMIEHATEGTPQFADLPEILVSDPQDVARAAVRGLLRGEPIVIPGAVNRATTFFSDNLPRRLRRRFLGALGMSRLRR